MDTTRFVTDGGLETDLIFHHGATLPNFSAFVLYDDARGRRLLRDYYRGYASIARSHGVGLRLETATWRAHSQGGARVGYDARALDRVNRTAVDFFADLETDLADISTVQRVGMIGPRDDGYRPGEWAAGDWRRAAEYHHPQISSLARAGVDGVCAYTLTGTVEAIGVVLAARSESVPVEISFTTEQDGRLPDGTPLAAAIEEVDAVAPADGYLLNCAHPTHLAAGLTDTLGERITGIRPNASRRSHAELDEADALDEGDVNDLAREVSHLAERLPNLRILGGCCGTDRRHVAAMWDAWDTAHLTQN